ncbi:hypothetical protein Hte_005046 [Hypoxylon texense]
MSSSTFEKRRHQPPRMPSYMSTIPIEYQRAFPNTTRPSSSRSLDIGSSTRKDYYSETYDSGVAPLPQEPQPPPIYLHAGDLPRGCYILLPLALDSSSGAGECHCGTPGRDGRDGTSSLHDEIYTREPQRRQLQETVAPPTYSADRGRHGRAPAPGKTKDNPGGGPAGRHRRRPPVPRAETGAFRTQQRANPTIGGGASPSTTPTGAGSHCPENLSTGGWRGSSVYYGGDERSTTSLPSEVSGSRMPEPWWVEDCTTMDGSASERDFMDDENEEDGEEFDHDTGRGAAPTSSISTATTPPVDSSGSAGHHDNHVPRTSGLRPLRVHPLFMARWGDDPNWGLDALPEYPGSSSSKRRKSDEEEGVLPPS